MYIEKVNSKSKSYIILSREEWEKRADQYKAKRNNQRYVLYANEIKPVLLEEELYQL